MPQIEDDSKATVLKIMKRNRCPSMMDRDEVSLQYFNQEGIQLQGAPDVDLDVFGLRHDVAMLARLAGAPDGSIITVSRLPGLDALSLSVHHPVFWFPSEYALFNDGHNLGLSMTVESIYVRGELQDQGIGTRSVMLTLLEAKAQGFRFVSLEAAGSAGKRHTFFGYHVWPSMGFDAALPTTTRRRLPVEFEKAERLSDLMQTEEGVQWWYDHGEAIELEFDLTEDSVSWQLCLQYANRKGIRL